MTKAFGNHELKFGGQYFDLKYQQIARYSGPRSISPFAEGALLPSDVDGDGTIEEGEEDCLPTGNSLGSETTSGSLVDVRNGFGGGNCDPTDPIYDTSFANMTCSSNPRYRVVRSRFNDPGETTASETSFFIQDT